MTKKWFTPIESKEPCLRTQLEVLQSQIDLMGIRMAKEKEGGQAWTQLKRIRAEKQLELEQIEDELYKETI